MAMPVIAKQKSPQVSLQASALLFRQLGKMFSKSNKAFTVQKVSAELNKSLLQLRTQVSAAEMVTFRDIVRELASQVDLLVLNSDSSALPATADPAELKRALREDELVKKILAATCRHKPKPMSTPQSISAGNKAVELAEKKAASTIAERIANHELISSGELQSALKVTRQALSNAVKGQRLFTIVGPSGKNYYPAYYADPTLDRRTLARVTMALGSLLAPSKHYFFTAKSTMLQDTPLDALRKGHEAQVLVAAASFAER
jgi:hypothetical protein